MVNWFLNQICALGPLYHYSTEFVVSSVGAAIESDAFQDMGIISQCDISNVVDINKIRRERIYARITLSSQAVVKDYKKVQFGLYFEGRKDRTILLKINRKES